MDIVITILVFFSIILIHELGHFMAARIFGMNVSEFSIGMGPRLFKIQGKKTLYSFKLLPIGGSVQLGEDFDSDDPDDFRNKPVWQRMITMVAGAFMNLVLGFLVCIVSVSMNSTIATTKVDAFYENSLSSQQFQLGDEIVEMSGMPVWTTMDISYCLQNRPASTDTEKGIVYFDITVLRNGERVPLTVPFAINKDENRTAGIVVDFMVQPEKKTVFNVISTAFKTALTEGRLIWITLMDFLNGTYGINDLSGPIGVVSTMSTAYRMMSFESFLILVAFITINIGIMNLLPIPALDGARFVFLVIELIRRKPISAEKEGMVHFIGFAALMILVIIVSFNDIMRLFAG